MSATELATLRSILEQGGIDFSADPIVERKNFDELFASFPQDESLVTRPMDVGGVSGLWADGGDGVLLYLHGGGYTIGSPMAYQQLSAGLARSSGTALFSADYRLAPEHRHPAAIEDAVAAYRGLLERGYAASSIVLGGDSAGGGLAIATLVALRDLGVTLPRAAFVLSPFADLSFSGESITSKSAVDPALNVQGLTDAASHYLGAIPVDTPSASPVFANLAGLPPLLIEVGEAEILLSDSTRLATSAAEAGVDVTLHVWPSMIHDWSAFAFMLSEGRELIAEVGAWVADRLAGEA